MMLLNERMLELVINVDGFIYIYTRVCACMRLSKFLSTVRCSFGIWLTRLEILSVLFLKNFFLGGLDLVGVQF